MEPISRVGIDLDGVIIDHREHACSLAREYGLDLESWQVNANVIGQFVPKEIHAALAGPLFCRLTPAAPIAPGALETLEKICDRVCIVSARRPDSIRFAQEWLLKYRIYDLVPAERIFFCGSDAEKRSYCEKLGLTVFLDDDLSVLERLPFGTQKVFFDADDLSGKIAASDKVKVVKDWEAFGRILAAKQ